MPIYTYNCDNCSQKSEQIRKIAERDKLIVCKRCRRPLERLVDFPASVWAPTSTSGGQRV